MTRWSRAIVSLAVVATISAACGRSEQPGPAQPPSVTPIRSAEPLRLTINSWIGYGPLFIAKEKGLFDGFDVQVSFIEDIGSRRSAMLAGQVDGYGSTIDNLAIDATFGVKGKTVLCVDESAGADGILAKSSVTWENLKGRTVAVQKGFTGHFLLLTALADHGLQPGDVKILDLDGDKAGGAIVAGTVDVAVTWEPWITKAGSARNVKKLLTTAEARGLIVDTLVLRDAVLAARPDDVRRVVQAWLKAIDWLKANPSEGNAIIAKAFKLDPGEVGGMVSGVNFFDREQNRRFMGTPSAPGPAFQLFTRASTLWKQAGLITAPVDPAQYFDVSFVQ